MSKKYDDIVTENAIDKKTYYKEVFKNIELILTDYNVADYYDLFFENPEYFSNSDHLNLKGAEVLSREVNKTLESLK